MNKFAIVAVVAILIMTASGLYLSQFSGQHSQVVRFTWHRTGGFIGLAETLIIDTNGSTSYESNRFGNSTLTVTIEEVKMLTQILDESNFFALDESYRAQTGAADYFTYSLTAHTTSKSKMVGWVDESVSATQIPAGLRKLQFHFLAIVEKVRPAMDAQKIGETVRNFIIRAPTFRFDGILETLSVTDVKALQTFPVQYIVTITFMSSHAGYGARAGKPLLQVITPHTAIIRIVEDKVVSVVLDNRWDELKQEQIS